MLLKKRKNPKQMAILQATLGRMRGIDSHLLQGGEPMLSNRLSAILTELQIVLEQSEVVQSQYNTYNQES